MKNLSRNTAALFTTCALLLAAAYAARALPAPQLAPAAPASFAGTYRHKTYEPGKEGYDNSLEVEDGGGGRLRVTLSGAYIYKANGEETMHEGGGAGDAILRGNVATASVTPDGGGEPCRVLIIFEDGEAGVKADGSCGFNIDFNGAYRGEKAGAARKPTSADASGLRAVRYDRLTEFVNEHRLNRTGTRFVITSVPAEKVSRVTPADEGRNRRGLFYLMLDENDGDASTSFVTTAPLVKNLRANAGHEAATLRVTATLVEFVGAFDVYRSSFVTRVEGLGEDGSLVWVATGAEPVKVRMRQ